MHVRTWVMTTAFAGCVGLAQAATAGNRPAAEAGCTDAGRSMVVGYFDHTAAWYRQRPGFRAEQTLPHVWEPGNPAALVVLYNDISASVSPPAAADAPPTDVGKRIEARSADIAEYLEAANRNGRIKVLLQVPQVLVAQWTIDPKNRDVVRDFIVRWSRYPALAGFYVFDEPDIKRLPVRTLQEVASLVKQHAPEGRNTVALSVANASPTEVKPQIREYASASPRAFDVLLVNRYPVFRQYARAVGARSASMGKKLGLTDDKANRENLADNEFDNLEDYYDSLVKVATMPGLGARPVYMSMQAYGLRDDCDGPACKAVNERNPRRSPTWNELLYLLTSIWMSGADGTVLYSHYYSLYDKALRTRLDNLEALMTGIYAYLPGCESVAIDRKATEGVMARYAGRPGAGKPDYLVIMHGIEGRTPVRISLDRRNRPSDVEELQFDTQGRARKPATGTAVAKVAGDELRLSLQGYGVKIFRLRYD
jgi:hypothetical protein